VYIAKLRKYLKLDDNVEILNIHGEGFRLVVKNSSSEKKSSEKSSFFLVFLFVQQKINLQSLI
jgi:hypothetical protein